MAKTTKAAAPQTDYDTRLAALRAKPDTQSIISFFDAEIRALKGEEVTDIE